MCFVDGKPLENLPLFVSVTGYVHDTAGTWPHCHTYSLTLENLAKPVVISEWHVVEVLTQTWLRAYKVRLGLMQPAGSWTVLRGRKSPIGLKTKLGHGVSNSAALLSLHHFFYFLSQKKKKKLLCPKGIWSHPVHENREQIEGSGFTLERHCLTNIAAGESKNDKTRPFRQDKAVSR